MLNRFARLVLTGIVLLSAVLACGSQTTRQSRPVPGNTRTDSSLQNDTSRHLMILQNMAMMRQVPKPPPCMDHLIVDAQNVSGPEKSTSTSWTNWHEVWTIRSCGLTTKYSVTFEPDGQGGSYIQAKPAQ